MDKKAIFIPVNILDTHWCCSVAINAKAMLTSPRPALHRCGFIYYDSLNSELETPRVKPPAILPLFFLLDLMVAYEGSANIKDGKKEVPKFRSMCHFDKWLCGERGHLTFDGNLLFPQLVLHKTDHSNFLIQRNGWDCGYYICIFLLDLAVELREKGLGNFISESKHHRNFDHMEEGQRCSRYIDQDYGIGDHVLECACENTYKSPLLAVFREQVVAAIDRTALAVSILVQSEVVSTPRRESYLSWLDKHAKETPKFETPYPSLSQWYLQPNERWSPLGIDGKPSAHTIFNNKVADQQTPTVPVERRPTVAGIQFEEFDDRKMPADPLWQRPLSQQVGTVSTAGTADLQVEHRVADGKTPTDPIGRRPAVAGIQFEDVDDRKISADPLWQRPQSQQVATIRTTGTADVQVEHSVGTSGIAGLQVKQAAQSLLELDVQRAGQEAPKVAIRPVKDNFKEPVDPKEGSKESSDDDADDDKKGASDGKDNDDEKKDGEAADGLVDDDGGDEKVRADGALGDADYAKHTYLGKPPSGIGTWKEFPVSKTERDLTSGKRQSMHEAFWKYLGECYANSDTSMDSLDEELKTTRIMETDQVAMYLHNIAASKKLQDKTKWRNGLHMHMETIKAAKEAGLLPAALSSGNCFHIFRCKVCCAP
jgi:hypothetical protein